jgi:anti-sigma factor RsiW
MTKCIGSPAQEMAEPYLAGELPESEADRFENHYIGCEPCHEYLLVLQEIRDGLAREPIAIVARAAEPAASRLSFGGKILAFPVPLAVLASLAAALVVGVVLVGVQRSTRMLQPGRSASNSTAASKPQPRLPDPRRCEKRCKKFACRVGSAVELGIGIARRCAIAGLRTAATARGGARK